jgi:hypothetical protein
MKLGLTNQEVFDKVAVYLLNQPERCEDFDEKCLYRGPNGNKCAVGFLIPDELYQPSWDVGGGTPVTTLCREDIKVRQFFEGVTPRLLVALQEVHDGCRVAWKGDEQIESSDMANRRFLLKAVAAEFNLSTSVMDAEKGIR